MRDIIGRLAFFAVCTAGFAALYWGMWYLVALIGGSIWGLL